MNWRPEMLTCCFLEVLLCFLGQFLNGRQVSLEPRLKDKHQSTARMWELKKKPTKKWFSKGLSFHLKWQKQRYSDHTTSSHPPALPPSSPPALSLSGANSNVAIVISAACTVWLCGVHDRPGWWRGRLTVAVEAPVAQEQTDRISNRPHILDRRAAPRS